MAIAYTPGGGGGKMGKKRIEKAPEPAWMERFRRQQQEMRDLQQQREDRMITFQANRNRAVLDQRSQQARNRNQFDPDLARASSWLGMNYQQNQGAAPGGQLKSLRRPEPMVYGNVPLSRFQQHEWLSEQWPGGAAQQFYLYPSLTSTGYQADQGGGASGLREYRRYPSGGRGSGGGGGRGYPTTPAFRNVGQNRIPQTTYPPGWLQRLVNWNFS